MCQTKESKRCAPGQVLIYISVHLVLIYTLAISNVLLLRALNFMVHKSSYCKVQFGMMSSENLSFIYNLSTSPPNERIPTEINNPTIEVSIIRQ